jgi:hypothetical protein
MGRAREPDAGRRAGNDDVAWRQRHRLAGRDQKFNGVG